MPRRPHHHPAARTAEAGAPPSPHHHTHARTNAHAHVSTATSARRHGHTRSGRQRAPAHPAQCWRTPHWRWPTLRASALSPSVCALGRPVACCLTCLTPWLRASMLVRTSCSAFIIHSLGFKQDTPVRFQVPRYLRVPPLCYKTLHINGTRSIARTPSPPRWGIFKSPSFAAVHITATKNDPNGELFRTYGYPAPYMDDTQSTRIR